MNRPLRKISDFVTCHYVADDKPDIEDIVKALAEIVVAQQKRIHKLEEYVRRQCEARREQEDAEQYE